MNLTKIKETIKKEGDISLSLYKGYTVLILRPRIFSNIRSDEFSLFHLCGYVGIPKGHSLYEKDYDKIDIECHGGLTFANFFSTVDKSLWFIGFDCIHAGDIANKNPVFEGTYKDIDFVMKECKNIINQIENKQN